MGMCVAFLRGINIGGRRVTNVQLVDAVASAGFTNVSAYQASGNVLFDDGGDPDPGPHVASALEGALGFEVLTFVRTAEEVAAIASAAPFPAELIAASTGKLQVTLLAKSPSAEAIAAAEELSTDRDRVVVEGRAWFWLPEGGISKSKLNINAVERSLGVGTTRTRGTVERITARLKRQAT